MAIRGGVQVDVSIDAVLGLVAGFFIYIAVSDIIPEIHKSENKSLAGVQSAVLILGAIIVSLVTVYLHQYIDQGHDHYHEGHSHSEVEAHHDHEEHTDEAHAHDEHHEDEHAIEPVHGEMLHEDHDSEHRHE